jgi:hypothetical protein
MWCDNEHEHNSTQQQQPENVNEEENEEVRLRGRERVTWRRLEFQPRNFRRDRFEFDWTWDAKSAAGDQIVIVGALAT